MLRAIITLAFIAALLLGLAVADFARRLQPGFSGTYPTAAVVFTGQFERVHAGLGLLSAGRIERLFISGVNPGAGIRIGRFAEQFGLDGGLRRALDTGRIVLGPRARTTRENAVETACWYAGQRVSGPLLLITSKTHMPRASWALERALPGCRNLAVPCIRAANLPPDRRHGGAAGTG